MITSENQRVKGKWLKIRFTSENGNEGYVPGSYLVDDLGK